MILDHIHALYNRAERHRIVLSNTSWALSEALRNYRAAPSPAGAEAVSNAAQGLERALLTVPER